MTLYNAFGDLRTQTPSVGSSVIATGSLATTVGSIYEIDVNDASGVLLYLRSGATLGGVITLEGLINTGDPSSWGNVSAVRVDVAPIILTGALTTLAASTGYRYRIDTNGLTKIRLRVSTVLGSALASLVYQKHVEAEPLFSVTIPNGTQPVSGAVTATSTPATGTAATLTTAATTNLTSIKTSAGTLYEITASNPTATPAYLKLYNKASAPVVATDVPIATIPIPASSFQVVNFGAIGKRFATGIAVGVTGAAVATDATAAVAGVQIHGTYI
jgi:hypothetical protein